MEPQELRAERVPTRSPARAERADVNQACSRSLLSAIQLPLKKIGDHFYLFRCNLEERKLERILPARSESIVPSLSSMQPIASAARFDCFG